MIRTNLTTDLLHVWSYLPGLYWVIDQEKKLVAISNLYLELIQAERTACLGKNVVEYFRQQPLPAWPSQAGTLESTLHEVLTTGREVRLSACEGSPRDASDQTVHTVSYDLVFVPVPNESTGQISYIIHQASRTKPVFAPQSSPGVQKDLDRLLKGFAQMVWTTNAVGEVEEDAPAWRAFTGQTYQEWKGFGWLAAVHPDDRELARTAWHKSVKEEIPVETTYRLRHISGQWVWTTVRAIPLRNREGTLQAWLGANFTISDRTQSDELTRQMNIYRTLTANLPQGAAFIIDRNFRYLLAEGQALQHIGQVPEAMEGKTIWEANGVKAGNLLEPYLQQALQGKSFRHEHEIQGRHYVSHGTPLYNQKQEVYATLIVSYDITDLKHTEESLRESEQKATLAKEVAMLGTWRYDLKTQKVFLDERMRQMWGVAPHVDSISWQSKIKRIHPDDRERVAQGIDAALRPFSSGQFVSEYRIVWDDGTVRWLSIRGNTQFEHETTLQGFFGIALDITERKQMEETLRQNEERLRRAMSIETVGIIFFNNDGTITYANDAFLQMSGYNREDLKQGRIRWDKQTPPEWMPHSLRALDELKKNGRTTPYEKEYIRKDGSRWWGLFAASSLSPDEGVEFVIDITGHKRAEETSRQSEDRLRLAMIAGGMGHWDWNPRTNAITWSPEHNRIAGLPINQSDGSYERFLKQVIPEDREKVVQALRHAIESHQEYNAEFRIAHNGQLRWISNLGRAFYDAEGQPVRMLGVIRDITERKQMEETLRQNEERLQLILQSAKDYAIFTLDKHRRIDSWNAGAERLLGYQEQEILGESVDIIFTEEDRQQGAAQQELDLAIRETHAENERWHIRKDGSLFWGSGFTFPLRDGSTEIRGFLKIMRDTTPRKKMEESLRQAKQEAERAAQAKEDFLAHMSHEIRTPLHAVVGLTDLMLQQQPRPDQEENLQTLKFSAKNLMALVNDILDFSKIQAGKVTFEQSNVNLRELLHSLQKAHHPHSLDHDNELVLHIDKDVPTHVLVDQLKLSQIMHNLVGNAVKFTQQGLITIEVSLNRQRGDQYWIDFAVSDTGIGIPADKLPLIFDTFTQANHSTEQQYGGTGLGLSITKLLLELMGSHIAVESQVGKGSRFFFTLQLPQGAAPATTPGGQSLQKDLLNIQDMNILLVEDSDINRMIVLQFLSDWWEIVPDEAIQGQQALEMVQQKQYDLILMDIRMPIMDGYQTAQAIRSLPEPMYQKVPIIALSADTAGELKKHPEASFFTDLITKPFDPQELRQKILRHSRLSGKKQTDTFRKTASINTQQVQQLFRGDSQSVEQFYEKAALQLNELKQKFATAVAQRDASALHGIMHKNAPVLNLFSLQSLEAAMRQCIRLTEEGAAVEEIERLWQTTRQEVEDVLEFLYQQQPPAK